MKKKQRKPPHDEDRVIANYIEEYDGVVKDIHDIEREYELLKVMMQTQTSALEVRTICERSFALGAIFGRIMNPKEKS